MSRDSEKTQLLENTHAYFKQREFVKKGDVVLFGIEILKDAIFPANQKLQWYFVVATDIEIRLYKLDDITYEYVGDFTSIPLKNIIKAKTKRTSVFFGEQYFVIKYQAGEIQINTPDKLFKYNQTEYIDALIAFFNAHF